MRLPEVLCASLLVIVLAASAPAQENRTDQRETGEYVPVPRLVVDEVEHNFGEVRAGRTLRWAFKIKNVGTADLLILSVAAS
jgi:hypothetical protein